MGFHYAGLPELGSPLSLRKSPGCLRRKPFLALLLGFGDGTGALWVEGNHHNGMRLNLSDPMALSVDSVWGEPVPSSNPQSR